MVQRIFQHPELDGIFPYTDAAGSPVVVYRRGFPEGLFHIILASGTDTLPTCCIGVGVP